MHNGNSLKNAFKTQITFGRGRGKGNSRFRGRGRGRYNFQKEEEKSPNQEGRRNQYFNSRGCNNNQTLQSYDRTNVQCYYCKNFEHFANDYRNKQAEMSKKNANFSESSFEMLFITFNVAQESLNDF